MLSKKDIEQIANLARLKLTQSETNGLIKDLADVLEYCETIQNIDTSGVDLDLSETHPENQTREDEAEDSEMQTDILDQAPEKSGNYFAVKEVLE